MVGWISQVLIAVVVLVTLPFILRKLLALHRYKQMIDKLPGPKPKYKMSAAMEYNVPREYLFQVFDKFFGTYGSIVQVWNLVYFSADVYMCKPEDVEVLLNSIKHIKKSTAYERMESWLGTGLLTSSGTKWHLHRKLITPAFHFNILEDFLQVFVERSKIFVKKLHKLSQESEVDLMPLISRCTLDIVCETAMGTTFNIQESAEHENYVSTVYEVNELITYREYRPWLYPDSVYYRTAAGKRYMQCLQKLHSFTENVIRERKEHRKNGQQKIKDDKMNEDIPGYKRRLALLDLLLETCETMTHPLTDLEIREEVDTFMFEGHDTTAMAIVWTLYLLGKHPDIQEKVAEELDHVLEGTERSFTYDDLSNMKYLERVIKEAQRLYPSVPMIARWLDEDLE
ncbi:cytochrome P450 4C1-like isoform X2 [Macrosteles quadrilineatus]|nr:cytochrome P450 4C1-like isoform X2 [Macrosteles quadrilineatus]